MRADAPRSLAILMIVPLLLAGCTGGDMPAANVAPETSRASEATCSGDPCIDAEDPGIVIGDDVPLSSTTPGVGRLLPENGTHEPGALVRVTFSHGVEGPVVASVHYGPSSVSDPATGSYPFVLVDTVGVASTSLDVPMPPSGPLFVRAHLTSGSDSWWSEERRYDPAGAGHRARVSTPSRMDAGVAFPISLEATTSAERVALAVMFARESADTLLEGDQLSRVPERTSQVLGVIQGGEGKVSGHVIVPMAGDWYVRPVFYRVDVHPHTGNDVILDRIAVGEATLLQVAKPSEPNLRIFTTDFACDTCPMTQLDAFVALNGRFTSGTRVDLLGFPTSTRDSVPRVSDGIHLGDARNVTSERIVIEFTRPDAVNYIRARIAMGDAELWSNEYRLSSLG